MREERKLNNAIKQDGVNTQSEILEELKRRYPQYVEQTDKKQAHAKKRRFALISALAAAVVCMAIIVPCAVLLPNSNTGTYSGGKENYRYCTQEEYSKGIVQYTIGEYRENKNRKFLYFDWYESGEDFNTYCYTSIADNEILCLEEQAFLPEKSEFVQLSITKKNVYLDILNIIIEQCENEYYVDNHKVTWDINDSVATCVFDDSSYRYFIRIEGGQDENRLFELVAKLLETK